MTAVTPLPIPDRESAVIGVLDAWVRSARAFAAAGVYPVPTGVDGVRLDRPAYTMLRELDQRGPRRLGDLAQASNLGVSHASRLVEGLVRDGLVERTVPTADRRVTILAVTPVGQAAAERIETRFRRLLTDRLQSFDEQSAIDFATMFQRFADGLVAWSDANAAVPSESP